MAEIKELKNELENESSKFRKAGGFIKYIQQALGLMIPLVALFFLIDMPYHLGYRLFVEQYIGIMFSLVFAFAYISVPAGKKYVSHVPWWDLLLAAASFGLGLYIFFNYRHIVFTASVITTPRIILSIIAVVVVFEATRRLVGWAIIILTIILLLYAAYGDLVPGLFQIRAIDWPRLITRLYLGTEFLFGLPLKIGAGIVTAFIIFAKFLFGLGGGNFFMDLGQSVAGSYRGGAAKISVIASSLFGMISGSAVANTAGTGSVTIPYMKRTGYSNEYAAAVEATASTGGQLAPPIMGAAAFLMAGILGIPYRQVVLIAIVPAFLFYFGVFLQVDLRSAKYGLAGLPRSELPPFSLKRILLEGWVYIIPVFVLIYTLFFIHLRAEFSVLYSLAVFLVLAFLGRDTRIKFRNLRDILYSTSEGLVQIIVISAIAGFIVGLVTYTGLGMSFTRLFLAYTDYVLVLLFVTMFASIILGMSMPPTVSYLLLAVLIAPAMEQLGLPRNLSHLFIFYYGTLSFLTPPVCLTVYIASSIAESDFSKTAIQALKLGVAGYMVPFLFIYNPALSLIGSPQEITVAIVVAILALSSLSIGFEGYLFTNVGPSARFFYLVSGLLLFIPEYGVTLALGGALFLLLSIINYLRSKGSAGSSGERLDAV